jgi:hypothetical protein
MLGGYDVFALRSILARTSMIRSLCDAYAVRFWERTALIIFNSAISSFRSFEETD